jgi:hypothetical protein
LRKGIKIKSSVLLLAWLVIFAHGVIPHNHMQEGHEGCSDIVHNVSIGISDCDKAPFLEDQPDDAKVCHFSNFLFKQIEQDNFIFPSLTESKLSTESISCSFSDKSSNCYISVPYFGTSPLRAPPSA